RARADSQRALTTKTSASKGRGRRITHCSRLACGPHRRGVVYTFETSRRLHATFAPGAKGEVMTIRTFQTGDEVAQVSIYNEAAAALPKFKAATIDEVRRRLRDRDFDPLTRFYALAAGKSVGYATFQNNGRVSFPWCRKGHEALAVPLLDQVLAAMRQRGMRRAFAAYRGDWPVQREFFLKHGFTQTREMINYVLDIVEMPTPAAR